MGKKNVERTEWMKQIYSFIQLEYRWKISISCECVVRGRKGDYVFLLWKKTEHRFCIEITVMLKFQLVIIYIYTMCSIRNLWTNKWKSNIQAEQGKKKKTSKTFDHRLCLLGPDSLLSSLSLSLSSYLWTSLLSHFFMLMCAFQLISVMFSTMRSDYKV